MKCYESLPLRTKQSPAVIFAKPLAVSRLDCKAVSSASSCLWCLITMNSYVLENFCLQSGHVSLTIRQVTQNIKLISKIKKICLNKEAQGT